MNLDTLVENFYKKEDKNSRLINEVLQFLLEGEKNPRGPAPSKEREERVLRFPILVPAEQSVGQYTADEESRDREIFELWMSKIGGSGASLGDKIKLLETWIKDPDSAAGSGTVAEALSYAMFLQTFSYMLREFNASVAGFLWEPFLAAMFGGRSVQVHTEEGDIADVKLDQIPGRETQRVSLKILREDGQVGGSFTDLVDHFAKNPGQSMIYVVIRKLGDEKVKTEMKFMQFPISEETFFEYIGHPKRIKEFEEDVWPYELPQDIAVGKLKNALRKTEEWAQREYIAGSKVSQILDAEGNPLRGRLPAGDVVQVVVQKAVYAPAAAGPGAQLSANAEHLWGDPDTYAAWYSLWQEALQNGTMKEFWKMAQGKSSQQPEFAPKGAVGYVKNKQFEISASYEAIAKTAEDLGTISIEPKLMTRAFQKAAEQIGGDLTAMFNALSALVGNVAKFFLIDCGDPGGTSEECKENDVKQRSAAGKDAIENAETLKTVVDARIGPSLRDSDDDGTIDSFDQDTYSGEEPIRLTPRHRIHEE